MKACRPVVSLPAALAAVAALVAAPVAAVVLLAVPSAAASTFMVTSPADSGAGSFRQAMLDATAANDDAVINFNAGLSVSITGADLGFTPASGTAVLTINGNGSTVTRTAGTDRILDDESSGLLTINDLTATGGQVISGGADGGSIFAEGSLTVNRSTISGIADASGPGGGSAEGGAVWSDEVLTINNSTITGTADAHATGGGPAGIAEGGGVWADEAITISNSTITGSTDAHAGASLGGISEGGAVWGDEAVTVSASSLSGTANANSSDSLPGIAEGGAIWADEPVSLTDTNVAPSSVTAIGTLGGIAEGGGVWTDEGATLTRSTIEGSLAQVSPSTGAAEGGGIWAFEGGTFTNSTVVGNQAVGHASTGGGVFDNNSDVALVYSDVTGNSASVGANIAGPATGGTSLSLPPNLPALPAGQPAPSVGGPHSAQGVTLAAFGSVVVQPGGGGENCAGFTEFGSTGFNFSDDITCGFTDPTDDQDPGNNALLGAPAANGGIPDTLLPGDASPLIDAIPNSLCQDGPAAGITTDERGLPRPEQAGGLCDIGAVEIQLPPPPPPAPTPTPSPAVVIQPRFTG